MASFVDHCIEAAGPGEIIDTCRDGTLHRFKKMFVCPYKDTVKCPRTDLFHEDNAFIPGPTCSISPVIYKRNGQSVCCIAVDLNEPTLMEALNRLDDLIEFRNEKENKNE